MMRRSILFALLLIPTFAFAQQTTQVVFHFDLSPSVRDALGDKRIEAIRLTVTDHVSMAIHDGSDFTTELPPGSYTVKGAFLIDRQNFILDPAGIKIEVPAVARFDARIPIDALIVTGKVTKSGEPFNGKIEIRPSNMTQRDWGFNVMVKDGSFTIPVPHTGAWRLEFWSPKQERVGKLPEYNIDESAAERELEIALP
jgi:hypothetical protein